MPSVRQCQPSAGRARPPGLRHAEASAAQAGAPRPWIQPPHGLGCLLAASLVLAGCVSPTPPSTGPRPDPVLETRARETLREAVPQPGRLQHRAIITAAGRQFSCDGIAKIGPDGSVRLALLTPVGVLAELRLGPDGATELLKRAPVFREDWVRRHLVPAARLVLQPRPGQSPAQPGPASVLSLHRDDPDGTRWTYQLSADGTRWESAGVGPRGRSPVIRAKATATGWQVHGPSFAVDLRTVRK